MKRWQRRNAAQVLATCSARGDHVGGCAGTQLHRAELGMVADFEYFSRHGATSSDDIAEVVNAVDGIYQSEIGVTIDLVTTVVFTDSSGPFSGATSPNSILNGIHYLEEQQRRYAVEAAGAPTTPSGDRP
jgi:hypothetical protein